MDAFIIFKNTVELILATVLSFIFLLFGIKGFALIINQYDKKFFFIYISAALFLLLAAAASLSCVLGFIQGIWLMPGIIFILFMMFIGVTLLNMAFEDRVYFNFKKLSKPITPTDVEKGLDWGKLEKWLQKK